MKRKRQHLGTTAGQSGVVGSKEDASRAHGMRICIKRKKIHYGKFFDFCAEKCVYN